MRLLVAVSRSEARSAGRSIDPQPSLGRKLLVTGTFDVGVMTDVAGDRVHGADNLKKSNPISWRPGVNVDGVFPLAEHPDGQ
jgi:hypothetical protein